MIEILSQKEMNKGSLKLTVSVRIKEWGLVINKICVFEKEGRRWLSMPQEYVEQNGQRTYLPLIKFDESQHMFRFANEVLKQLDAINNKTEIQEELPF